MKRYSQVIEAGGFLCCDSPADKPTARKAASQLAKLEARVTIDELYYQCTEMFPVEPCRIHVEWDHYRKPSPFLVEELPPMP